MRSYIQLDVGHAVDGGYSLRVEYGKNWRFLDVGLSLGAINTIPLRNESFGATSRIKTFYPYSAWTFFYAESGSWQGSMSTLLMLHVRLDIINLFWNESNHSARIGVGYGMAHIQRTYKIWRPEVVESGHIRHHLANDIRVWTAWNFSLEYAFAINERVSLSAFYNGVLGPEHDVLGIGIRRYFR